MTLPRVYPILDTGSLARLNADALETTEAFLEGGAQILQLRHKSFWDRHTFDLAQQIAKLCRQANAAFIINDRADYALLTGAGLHIGQDDLSPEDARTVIGPDAVLGFSTHNPAQIEFCKTKPISYVAFGPVFPTTTKERPDPSVGIETLRAIRSSTMKPLVAIGGITRDNAWNCWNAGADSVAVIADLLPHLCDKRTLRDRMVEWQQLSSR
jgi:thiamine-phosphate pyrophosphorylase